MKRSILKCLPIFALLAIIISGPIFQAPVFADFEGWIVDEDGDCPDRNNGYECSYDTHTGHWTKKLRVYPTCSDFLGFTTWNCNANIDTIKSEDDLKFSIVMIATNIAKDIAVAAAYLVIGYVIYGGYLYTFSGGDPGKVATGKKTLVQAFTGLAITMLATIILDTIRIALVGNSGKLDNCVTAECVNPGDMVEGLIGWAIGIIGLVSAAFLISGAIQYITSSGDPGRVKKAKDTILYSLIGLIIVALATAITAFVSSSIRSAEQNAFINNKSITKEINEKEIS